MSERKNLLSSKTIVCLLFCLSASASFAQTQTANASTPKCGFTAGLGASAALPCEQPRDATATVGPVDEKASVASAEAAPVETAPEIFAPALNGGEPIPVKQLARLRYLYGLSTSQGFDSAAAGPFRDLPTWTSAYDGYIGASWQMRQSYVVLQHESTLTHYGSSEIQGQSFHRTSLLATGEFSPRWSWNFEARNGIGDDQLQLINPLAQRMIGSVAIPEPDTAIAGSTSSLIWSTDLAAAVTFSPNENNSFTLRTQNAYHSIFADNTHDNISTLRVEYERRHSERFSYGAYGQTIRQTGDVVCSSSGGGLQTSIKITEASVLEAAAGPEVGSGGCRRQQGFNLHVATMTSLNANTQTYFSLNREFSSGYLTSGTWEDNVVAGIQKKLSRRMIWDLNAGYVKGTVIGSLSSYHGFFASTELRERISRSFTGVATYRRFDQSVSQTPVRRNIVMFSLLWTPTPHDARRNAEHTVMAPNSLTPGSDDEN
jgi:hypothetical protein